MKYLRIKRVPNGEAPFWVREKWVGIDIPLLKNNQNLINTYTAGVLTGPKNFISAIICLLSNGYVKKCLYSKFFNCNNYT